MVAREGSEPSVEQLQSLVDLCDRKKLEEAMSKIEELLLQFPESPSLHNYQGAINRATGQLEKAKRNFEYAVALKPDYVDAYNNLGCVQQDLRGLSEAAENYRRALELKPDYVEAHSNLGNLQREMGDFLGAEASYHRALELKPDNVDIHLNLARMPSKLKSKQIDQLHRLLEHSSTRDSDRAKIGFALGEIYDSLDKVEQAFCYFQQGNSLRRDELGYDLSQDEQRFESNQARFKQAHLENFVSTETPRSTDHIPVFILGMPRSGTTLVEQVISSHSEVFGAGELPNLKNSVNKFGLLSSPLTKENIGWLREDYLTSLKALDRAERYITDKLPFNFLLIGWICLALPEARIIHVKRSSMATCWSIYRHYFPSGHGYSCSLKDLGYYYKLYLKLMEYWRDLFPQHIYELNYEQLTEAQEPQTRELIAQIGLSWEASCLEPEKNSRVVKTASNQQVRQKVYRGSSQQWKRYEAFLDELKESLAGPLKN